MTFGSLFLILLFIKDVRAAVRDEVETVEVTEGVNVTLKIELTGIKSYDVIAWRFGATGTRIAQLVNRDFVNLFNGTFTNRLQLDKQTGSLTISNIRTTDSGLYKTEISSEERSTKHFNVTVHATLSVPNITHRSSENQSQSERSSVCSVVCSVRNAYKVILSWYRENHLLSSISDPDNSTLSLPLDIEHGDYKMYSCVAANPISNQTAQFNIAQCEQRHSRTVHVDKVLNIILCLAGVILLLLVLYLTKKLQNEGLSETGLEKTNNYTTTEYKIHPECFSQEEPTEDLEDLLTFVTYCSVKRCKNY